MVMNIPIVNMLWIDSNNEGGQLESTSVYQVETFNGAKMVKFKRADTKYLMLGWEMELRGIKTEDQGKQLRGDRDTSYILAPSMIATFLSVLSVCCVVVFSSVYCDLSVSPRYHYFYWWQGGTTRSSSLTNYSEGCTDREIGDIVRATTGGISTQGKSRQRQSLSTVPGLPVANLFVWLMSHRGLES